MQDILNGIGDGISQFLNDPTVQTLFRATVLYIALIWLAAAYWAYRDLRTRSTNPLLPYGAAAAIILFTPLLFPLGVLLYRIVRPPETVAEASERALAEEAMLVEVEKQRHCAACKQPIEPDWIVCPHCRTRLRRICSNCGRLVETDWTICAYCGKDFELPEHVREPIRVPTRRPAQAVLPGPAQAAQLRASPRSQPIRSAAAADDELPRAAPEPLLKGADRLTSEVPEPRTATQGS